MLKRKQAGIAVSREPAAPRPPNVASIMDALRRSLAQETAVPAPQPKSRKRAQRQGEMLLPMPGRKDTGAAPLSANRSTGRRKQS